MPSMHVGQTVLYALSITWLLRTRWRWLVWLWPAMMLLTVMVTANHYWLDGVGGTGVVLLALTITTLVLRRPAPWRALRAPRVVVGVAPGSRRGWPDTARADDARSHV
jgi:membrane-associated phospholipid phosphatase